MWLVGVGLLMFLLHALDIGPPGRWNLEFFGDLWKFLVPFGLAALWWAFSDSTGLTQRRAVRRMEERLLKRRERDMRNLGLDVSARRSGRRGGSPPAPNPASGAQSSNPREPRV